MDEFTNSLIAAFFSKVPNASPSDCHEISRQTFGRSLDSAQADQCSVVPNPYQGSSSYTCIMSLPSAGLSPNEQVIQFRFEPIDLWGNHQAHKIHGRIIPFMVYHGRHRGLHVYSSPCSPGVPYISLLMEDVNQLPLAHRLRTVADLARLLSAPLQTAHQSDANTIVLDDLKKAIENCGFYDLELKMRIENFMILIYQQPARLAKLPVVFSHMDLTPFNYLVHADSGDLAAVIDWVDSRYLPIGHSFHFIELVLGALSSDGWESFADSQYLEGYFWEAVRQNVMSQGIQDIDLAAMKQERLIGVLAYYVPKLDEWEGRRAEKFLQHFFPPEADVAYGGRSKGDS